MNPTQEMVKRLFLSIAISVAALIAGTGSATADVTRCDEGCGPGEACFLESGTYDTLLVPKGTDCVVSGGREVTVQNNVNVQEDASLLVQNSTFTVNGNLNGDILDIRNSVVMIIGNVTITGSRGFLLQGVNIGGHLHISGSKGDGAACPCFTFGVENSSITGNVLLENNTTKFGIRFVGNQVVGNVTVCHSNTPSPTWFGNNVTGKIIGDCPKPIATDR
jgi:hypothetical protein